MNLLIIPRDLTAHQQQKQTLLLHTYYLPLFQLDKPPTKKSIEKCNCN